MDSVDEKSLDFELKYNYVKNLRAQLSNYEQMLLYYNSLSRFGQPWIEIKNVILKPYLIKYKMIKNIPLSLADFGIKPEEKFETEIEILHSKKPPEELFEWQEIVGEQTKSTFYS